MNLHKTVAIAEAAEDVRSRGGRLQKGAAYRCVVVISPREARKKIFAFIFQLSGWALVAPSCLYWYSWCTRINAVK